MIFHLFYNPQETDSTDTYDEARKYINETLTQLFYTVDMIRDLYYRYAFSYVG